MKKTLPAFLLFISSALSAQSVDMALLDRPLADAPSETSSTLELLSFQAESTGPDGVTLMWSTATERTSEHFFVERSQDQMNWVTAMEVDGVGGTDHTVYELIDPAPFEGVSYYRLRTFENGQRTELSDIYSVSHEPAQALTITAENIPGRFVVSASGTISNVQMLNNRGQFVAMPIDYQNDLVRVNAELIEPGTYYVQAVVNGNPVLRTVIITSTSIFGG